MLSEAGFFLVKCHDRRYIFFWGGLCSGWGLLCFINQYKMLWNDRKKRPDRERERERDFRRAKLMAVSVCGGGRVTFSFLFFLVGPVGFARQYWVLDLFCLPSFFLFPPPVALVESFFCDGAAWRLGLEMNNEVGGGGNDFLLIDW